MMQSKNVNIFLLVATAVFLSIGTLSAEGLPPSLDALIAEAVNNNPRIRQAYHKWQAAIFRTHNVRGLPDPNFSYGYFGENIETRVGPQEQKFKISQTIPFPGKLKSRGAAQSKEAQILKEKYDAVTGDVVKDVKLAFYDLYWLDKALAINKEEKQILEKIEDVAQRKYESDLLPQQDVIKLQVELSKIMQKISLIKQNRKSSAARMNQLLNRPLNDDIDVISQVEKRFVSYDVEELIEQAKNSRQELLAADLAVAKMEIEKSLAKREYLPDFTLGYEYIEVGGGTTSLADDGKDAWMGTVSVNVPLWFGKTNSAVKSKEQELKAARENQQEFENLVDYEVRDIYFKVETYREIVSLYETALVPQAQQAFDVSQTGFETGAVSFLDWLDAQRTSLQTRLAYYKSLADYLKAGALLERAVGMNKGGNYEQ